MKMQKYKKTAFIIFCSVFIAGAAVIPLVLKNKETDISKLKISENVKTSVERISEHRFALTVENLGEDTIFLDETFELYSMSGKKIKAARDCFSDVTLGQYAPFVNAGGKRTLSMTLSLAYGSLKPGSYRLLKRVLRLGEKGEEAWVLTGEYISAVIELENGMSDCDYPANPREVLWEPPWSGKSAEEISVYAENITPRGCDVVMKNNGETRIESYLHNGFIMYELVNGEYFPLYTEHSIGFFLMGGQVIPKDRELRVTVGWSGLYGELPQGTYKLVGTCGRSGNDDALIECEIVV